jgi:hypothetical protein
VHTHLSKNFVWAHVKAQVPEKAIKRQRQQKSRYGVTHAAFSE